MARIKGTSSNDNLTGTATDDVLIGGGGNDILTGREGNDVAKYLDNIAEYRFSNVNGKLLVTSTGAEGKDTLSSVEALQFGNGELTVSNVALKVNSDAVVIRSNPSMITLRDDSFVVTWSSMFDDGIYAQRFNAEGIALSEEFQVNTTPISIYFDGANIAGLSNGGFVISWEKGSDIYAQIYTAQGIAQGGEFQLGALHSDSQQNSKITALANGDFVVIWENGIVSDGIFAQRYNAVGVEQGDIFKVNSNAIYDGIYPSIATLSDGGFVVSWSYNYSDGSGFGVFAQRYNAAGLAQGSEFQVNTTTHDDQFGHSIAALVGGGFVVTWNSDGQDGSIYGVYAQRYDEAGVRQGNEFRVNTTIDGGHYGSSISALADGGFVVVWVSVAGGLYAQRYNSEGTAQGIEFWISNINATYPNQFSVTALADGDFVVSWASQYQEVGFFGDYDASIFAQRYDAFGNAVGTIKLTGTANADMINLDKGTEGLIVDGLGGNDTINGASNNDTLLGGAGKDLLNGRAGDDSLDGGDGVDILNGGTGDDTYIVGAGDTVTELTNAGIDTVKTNMSYTLTANVENLIFTYVGTTVVIKGVGNTQANLIIGNMNDNLLDGKAGADVIDGGLGNDTLIGGAGNDLLEGGAGNDIFRFNTALSASNNVDEILDFNVTADTIQLSKTIFTTIGAGSAAGVALDAGAFVIGTAADSSDRIIYNSTTGDLYYDKDGTGAVAAIKFAHLDTGLSLTSADFSVIL